MYSDRPKTNSFGAFLAQRGGEAGQALVGGGPAGDNRWTRGGGSRGRGRGRGRGGSHSAGPAEPGQIVFNNGDKDGDVGMGNEEETGKKRFAPYGSRGGKQQRVKFDVVPKVVSGPSHSMAANEAILEITNWEKGTEDELKKLIFDKTKVNLRNITYSGPLLLAKLPEKEALQVRRGAAALKFKGEKLGLAIQKPKTQPGASSAVDLAMAKQRNQVAGIVEAIKNFVRQRWNAEVKICDISGIGEDPAIRKAGVRSLEDGKRTGEVVCKVLGELCPGLESLRADRLHLHSLHPVSTLLANCPHLKNLSLAHNKLPNLDALLPLRNAPFHEVILIGNPVRENEVRKNGTETLAWRNNVKKIFPKLQILDDSPVEDIEEDMEEAGGHKRPGINLPKPIRKGFIDSENTKVLVADFISKFFPLFDANRNAQALQALYHPSSCFSLSVSTQPPPERPPQRNTPVAIQRKNDDLSNWFPRNRSFERTKGAKRDALLSKGPTQIIAAFTQLPQTRHPRDESKMVVDAWIAPLTMTEVGPTGQPVENVVSVVFLTIHGELIEWPANKRKSFSRTFIMAPSDGTPAQVAGWGYTILNDEMHVRIWSTDVAWRDALAQGADPAAPGAVAAVPQQQQQPQVAGQIQQQGIMVPGQTLEQALQLQAQHGLSPEQHNVILQIQLRTRLTYPFAVQLVTEAAWDLEKAVALLEAARANVPADAFLPA